MSFQGTSQDSRDPNSPQWGYLKVRDPETELSYPAKDEIWNEYVMFVHDTNMPIDGIDYEENKETGVIKIKRRTDFRCIMVPAKLTIDCDVALRSINEDINKWRAKIQNCEVDEEEGNMILERLENGCKVLSDLKEKNPDGFSIPSTTREDDWRKAKNPPEFDETTLWVALVTGPK